jgi:hypothetical protein
VTSFGWYLTDDINLPMMPKGVEHAATGREIAEGNEM